MEYNPFSVAMQLTLITQNLNLPVIIHTHTTNMEMLTLSSSADVNRPQTPSDILFLFPQGLISMYV